MEINLTQKVTLIKQPQNMEDQSTFISYSRKDLNFVLKLARDLKAAGVKIWLDKIDIKPGDRWDNSIQTALEECGSLLVVYSPSSVSSENVIDEVSYALGKNRPVIPVMHERCDVPFRYRRLQYIDFTENYSQALPTLVAQLTGEKVIPIIVPGPADSSENNSDSGTAQDKKPPSSKKNVAEDLELEVEGSVSIGDKQSGDQEFDQKNILKKSKIKTKGDFSLGDG